MLKVLNQSNSAANHFLFEMRHIDTQKDRAKFRNNLRRLGAVMAYEISRTLKYAKTTVTTPLDTMEVELLAEQPVLISILRAALPFSDGFVEMFDQADVGFVGAYRKGGGEEIVVNFEYMATPSLDGRVVIVVDPMLATGKSAVESIDHLLNNGKPSHIHIAAAVAAPEGIDYLSRMLKVEHTIWTGALDEKLNSKSYIVPGLGDAGDLCFGPKL
ncbi:uracil phosphoribosyltransferase [Fulvivirga sp. 29W222]|uniref:Uracil phosphoribosyltransferase n=1 Tax=Fulvivirga marina TaxID=2494733 RepID=A0A937FXG3_9BACT|nr:uracil phosphoribosyltransferase [Fulvivirga marina]MBL6446812.1 uracil phosphoribosyltransferase [Fulvivirga marina]